MITDNTTGEVFSKTFDFKTMKEYLKFVTMSVNNSGLMLIETKVREDVITLSQSTAVKGQLKYYFFSVGKNSDDKAAPFELISQPGKYFCDPIVTALNSGEVIVAYDFFSSAQDKALKGIALIKFDENLTVTGQREITPNAKFIPQIAAANTFKKGKEFSNLKIQQVLPLSGKNFMLLAEYSDTIANADKSKAPSIERNYMIAYRIDDNMNVTAQHFIPKKQISSTVCYAFSLKGYAKGNDAYLFTMPIGKPMKSTI